MFSFAVFTTFAAFITSETYMIGYQGAGTTSTDILSVNLARFEVQKLFKKKVSFVVRIRRKNNVVDFMTCFDDEKVKNAARNYSEFMNYTIEGHICASTNTALRGFIINVGDIHFLVSGRRLEETTFLERIELKKPNPK